MKYTKTEAINKIQENAKIYRDKLANTSLLIVYKDRMDSKIKNIEVMFLPNNFQHLTGVKMLDEKGNIREHTAKEFYNRSLYKPFITESEIQFKEDGTTPLKLDAMHSIMNITKISKIAGNYNNYKPKLKCDYVIGNVNSCLCLTEMSDDALCYPTSALSEDIRKLVTYSSQVLFVMQAPLINEQTLYEKIVNVAKGININKIKLPKDILDKINPEVFNCNKIYNLNDLINTMQIIEKIRIELSEDEISGKIYNKLLWSTEKLRKICNYYKNVNESNEDIKNAYTYINNNSIQIRNYLVWDNHNKTDLDKEIIESKNIKTILNNLKSCIKDKDADFNKNKIVEKEKNYELRMECRKHGTYE